MTIYGGPRAFFGVDIQVGFLNSFTHQIPERVEEFLNLVPFDLVVFTQFINLTNGPFADILNWRKLQHSPETDLAPELRGIGSVVLDKHIYTPDHAAISTLMFRYGIRDAYVAGIDTDVCVLMTATLLFQMGIHTRVLADLSMSHGGPEYHDAALTILPRIIGGENVILDSEAFFGLANPRSPQPTDHPLDA